ncbi:MAG: hypothetical protein QNJ14_11765 [Woeseiaceae bacterium]|nr:hypothetical protein [Woeseiaceae bacterium]
MNERVYMVWDYYDGVRSGVADFGGEPHFFQSRFDDVMDEYVDVFDLTPLDCETFENALELWEIYRAWEIRFHSGKEPLNTHPRTAGDNSRYNKLDSLVQSAIESRKPTAQTVAKFHVLEEQPGLPVGCMKEMEVEWV